ncbi:MAG: putative hydrolase of the superfamily [Frankiales bacterium]|nr:putative hydrolase of the superfamily [Frankiales bacterium]
MSELRAVTVDLDDTLFPQSSWLAGAWSAAAGVAESFGFDRVWFADTLVSVAAEGSDRGGIIDRTLLAAGIDDPAPLLPPLVSAFSGWAPSSLPLYRGVSDALARLRSVGLCTAVITDGNPQIQRSKLAALGLNALVDHVVISDEIGGRATRKPSPAPFLRALELCGTSAAETIHIGDRPAKDVAGAAAAGMRCIRVRTGEYADIPDGAGTAAPWATAATFTEAVDRLLR